MKNSPKRAVIILLLIIAVFVAAAAAIFYYSNSKTDSGDTTADTSTETQTAQVEASENDQYMVTMIGRTLGEIEALQGERFDSLQYDNYCDAGPSLNCTKTSTDEESESQEYKTVYFAVNGYTADENSVCTIVNACGQSSKLTEELTSAMTLAELKEKAGTISEPAYDDYEGYYVTFDYQGHNYEYYWGFDFSSIDYTKVDENTLDYKTYARDPQNEKTYGVYVF